MKPYPVLPAIVCMAYFYIVILQGLCTPGVNTPFQPHLTKDFFARSLSTNVYVDHAVPPFPLVGISSSTSFHLVSHGRSGELYLDGEWRDATAIVEFIKKNNLFDNGISHLNIYGCEFGKDQKGRSAVNFLHNSLGVEVSASNNITGKDGDWDLEVGLFTSITGVDNYNYNLQCAGTPGGSGAGDDFDEDGICNDIDIDDDNDGILDAVESPGCFYTATEANTISTITSQFSSPDDDQSDGDIQLLHNGSATPTFNFNTVVSVSTGSNLFTMEYPIPVKLAGLQVSGPISAAAGANAVVVGSNDGSTWSAPLSALTLITTTPVTFSISTAQPYQFYKIQTGLVTGALSSLNAIGEITSTLATGYNPSDHPRPTCANDTDDDDILNHYDLDSDGDTYPDAAEAGVAQASGGPAMEPGVLQNMSGTTTVTNAVVSGSRGSNGFANSIETFSESGIYDGSYTYAQAIDGAPCPGCAMLSEVLPLKLITFSAKQADKTVLLGWKTTDEVDNDYFDIERSADSKNWMTIGMVKGKNQPGIHEYHFIDHRPFEGNSYYRLKQTDIDGKYSYSPIRFVNLRTASHLRIMPNPAQSYLVVKMASVKPSDIIILNASGKNVTRLVVLQPLAINEIKIGLQRLANGFYIIKARQYKSSFIKQRQ